MANVFSKTKPTHDVFQWEGLGNIKEGRQSLGEFMPVLVYRLLEYTMLDVLTKEYGSEKAHELFFKSGYLAGEAICSNALDKTKPLDGFIADLQKFLKDNLMGILKIEHFDDKSLSFILTVGEDLDCSGLKSTDEVVCHYDEGFICGIMNTYTGKKYNVKEIDCWANGDRVCRFRGEVIE